MVCVVVLQYGAMITSQCVLCRHVYYIVCVCPFDGVLSTIHFIPISVKYSNCDNIDIVLSMIMISLVY